MYVRLPSYASFVNGRNRYNPLFRRKSAFRKVKDEAQRGQASLADHRPLVTEQLSTLPVVLSRVQSISSGQRPLRPSLILANRQPSQIRQNIAAEIYVIERPVITSRESGFAAQRGRRGSAPLSRDFGRSRGLQAPDSSTQSLAASLRQALIAE